MNEKIIPKILAIYLPQFHETEDNNLWWGKGFTDWDSVKKAEVCFEGHRAPWKPQNNNYYDLNKVDTLKWQSELASKYGIDGFCFYHYYFKNGKKELEKPAELLLHHKEINMPFCFNWANESWIRSWSKVNGNVWSEKFEQKASDNEHSVLVEQDYGNSSDWENHFNYLLPFFKDDRYICIDEKPIFIFYIPADIKCLNDMISLWRKLALNAGLKGLYLIGANCNASLYELDASMVYEPRMAINRMNESDKAISLEGVRCFHYNDAWDAVLKDKPYVGAKTYFTGITRYDDTPRRGKSGEVFIDASPEKFGKEIQKLIKKSMNYDNELVFINAWNEWGEGMYLEPDEANGYKFLEEVKAAKIRAAETYIENSLEKVSINNNIDEEKIALVRDIAKYKTFLEYYDKWLYLQRRNRFSIENYLKSKNVSTVSIYGLGMLGKQVYEQLTYTNLNILYGIDQYVGQVGTDLKIIRPESSEWPCVDAIIVTAFDEKNIETKINEKVETKVIRLSQLIEDLWRHE